MIIQLFIAVFLQAAWQQQQQLNTWDRCVEGPPGTHVCDVFDANTDDYARAEEGDLLRIEFPSSYTVNDRNGWVCGNDYCLQKVPTGFTSGDGVPVPCMTCPDSPATCPCPDPPTTTEPEIIICLPWYDGEGLPVWPEGCP